MRTTSLLLPVRYSNAFYSATITDPVVASVSRVALYHDPQLADTPLSSTRSGGTTSVTSTDKVIGGIRCRLEPFSPTDAAANNLYIQTLHLLSAYRGHGIATSLLESLIYAPSLSPPSSKQSTPRRPSDIVQHYNIRTVTAHVHEANDEALNWYRSRGFSIQDGVVEGYYRRLKPSGAKIVKLDIARDEEQTPHNTVAADQEDEDWEKVEAEDCCPTAEEADAERIRKKVKSR
jgi:ribosomal protein S18 acetylase RimI-like enzyme